MRGRLKKNKKKHSLGINFTSCSWLEKVCVQLSKETLILRNCFNCYILHSIAESLTRNRGEMFVL